MAENKFLESSRARSELLREKHEHNRQSAEERGDFWIALKSYLADWNDRLDQLDNRYGKVGPSLTEDDKRTIQLDLTRLKDQLAELRRRCLSSGTANSSLADSDEQSLIPLPPDSLPFGDLRLLHEELQRQQAKFDTIKVKLLPKGKFIFKRYRKAVEQLRAQGIDLEQMESATIDANETPRTTSSTAAARNLGSSIFGLEHALIQVDAHGFIRIQFTGANGTDTPALHRLEDAGSVVLSDIVHSTIEL